MGKGELLELLIDMFLFRLAGDCHRIAVHGDLHGAERAVPLDGHRLQVA